MSDERRASPRVEASLPGELETSEGKTSIAISRDISSGGLLLLTRIRLDVGAKVKLKVAYKDEQLPLTGTVVRVDDLEPGASVLWRREVAVKIDRDDAVLGELFDALSAASSSS